MNDRFFFPRKRICDSASRQLPLCQLLLIMFLCMIGNKWAMACSPSQPIEDCLNLITGNTDTVTSTVTGPLIEKLVVIGQQFEWQGDMLVKRVASTNYGIPNVPELKSIDSSHYQPLSSQSNYEGLLWPKALIPLWTALDERITDTDRAEMAKVCYGWGLIGNLDCYPYENADLRSAQAVNWGSYEGPPYVVLTKNENGCYAAVAELSLDIDAYQINIAPDCWATPALYHESGHTFIHKYHTHQRPPLDDWIGRDSVLAVQWANIQSIFYNQFNYAWGLGNIGPYDCRDIMHYSRYAGAIRDSDGNHREAISFYDNYAGCRDVAGFVQAPSVTELLSVALIYGFRTDMRLVAFPDDSGGVRLRVWGADPNTQMHLLVRPDDATETTAGDWLPFADPDQTWTEDLNASRRWVRIPDTPDPGLWERRITRADLEAIRPGVYTFELSNAALEYATITLYLGHGYWDWLVDMAQFWPQHGWGRYAGLPRFDRKLVTLYRAEQLR